MATDKARARAHSRRPILDSEVPYLDDLGTELRRLRIEAHLTIVLLAEMSELGERQMRHVLNGTRRTRSSTLLRVAAVLAKSLGIDAKDLHAHLVEIAGPAIAPEPLPEHRAHLDRRHASRVRKKERDVERKRQDRLVKSIQSELRQIEARRLRRQSQVAQAPKDNPPVVSIEGARRKDRQRKQETKDRIRPPLQNLPYVPKKQVSYVKAKPKGSLRSDHLGVVDPQ